MKYFIAISIPIPNYAGQRHINNLRFLHGESKHLYINELRKIFTKSENEKWNWVV